MEVSPGFVGGIAPVTYSCRHQRTHSERTGLFGQHLPSTDRVTEGKCAGKTLFPHLHVRHLLAIGPLAETGAPHKSLASLYT